MMDPALIMLPAQADSRRRALQFLHVNEEGLGLVDELRGALRHEAPGVPGREQEARARGRRVVSFPGARGEASAPSAEGGVPRGSRV